MWSVVCAALLLAAVQVQGNGSFATKLYQAVAQDKANVLVSPASLQLMLGLAWLGARGNTERQLAQGLGLGTDREIAQLGLQKLQTHLKGGNGLILEVANQMFLDRKLQVKESFQTSAASILQANASPVEFQTNPERARSVINQWVGAHTGGRIPQLFDKGTITPDVVLVLANTVYFKAPWDRQFKVNRTRTKPFFVSPDVSVPVQMMAEDGVFKYAYVRSLDAKVVQLPYRGQKSSMVVLLPVKKDGLPKLEAGLGSLDLDQLIRGLEADDDPIYLELPRFKLELKQDLAEALHKLGVTDMFESGADFSGLTDGLVKVDKMLQSSIIETNEEGSEAAAASGSEFVNYSSPTTFIANHPFIFLVRDDETGTVLFIGRYAVPT